jgi:hypothetical protein
MDYKNALALFYVIMFGQFFGNFLSCDLQRMFMDSVEIKHLLGIVSVFFLLTSIDTKVTLVEALNKTLFVYCLYIISTKSKAITVVPMLLILFADQVIKVYLDTQPNVPESIRNTLEKLRKFFGIVIIMLIVGGLTWYFIRAKLEFKDQFSYHKFFLGTNKCANLK